MVTAAEQRQKTIERLDGELDRLRDLQGNLKLLMKHPGWVWYEKQLLSWLETKRHELSSPPEDLSSEQKRTYVAGEAHALYTVVGHVSATHKGLQSQIEALAKSLEDWEKLDISDGPVDSGSVLPGFDPNKEGIE